MSSTSSVNRDQLRIAGTSPSPPIVEQKKKSSVFFASGLLIKKRSPTLSGSFPPVIHVDPLSISWVFRNLSPPPPNKEFLLNTLHKAKTPLCARKSQDLLRSFQLYSQSTQLCSEVATAWKLVAFNPENRSKTHRKNDVSPLRPVLELSCDTPEHAVKTR